MEALLEIISWRPTLSSSGNVSNVAMLIMILMSFLGAGVVMRLTQVASSFNFAVNFSVMLIGCFAFREFGTPALFPTENEIVASAVTANFGMTLAGFVLLLAYRNTTR